MFSETDKSLAVQLAAAALSAGSNAEEAWHAATYIMARLNADPEAGAPDLSPQAIDQSPYTEPRILQISDVKDAEGHITGAMLEFGEQRVFVDWSTYLLLEGMGDYDYLTLDLIKKYAIYRAQGSESRDYDAIPNYKAYNVVRDMKRLFAHLGIDDAVQSVKGHGWYLKNLQIYRKDQPNQLFMSHFHAH